jgi:hypothetical protein
MPGPNESPRGHVELEPTCPPPTDATRLVTNLLGSPLTIAVAVWCVAVLGCWIPNDLILPWYTDHDHFAMVAQRWAAGFLPYRDTFSMQFPGEIYLFSLLGHVAGWGNSVVFFGVDVGLVLGFGGLLLAWGRKKSGRWLPGLVGFAAFLSYYTNLNYAITAQRDWHGMFFAAVSLLVLDLLPGRAGRIISGIAYGLALTFRPQFALLAPALAFGLVRVDRESRIEARRTILGWLEWGGVAAITLLVAFFPLICSGVLDDFLRCLKTISYGSNYNTRTTSDRIISTLRSLWSNLWLILIPIAILALGSGRIRSSMRGTGMVILALLGMVCYSGISPLPHLYYQIPVHATLAIATTFALCFVELHRRRSMILLVSILWLLASWQPPKIPIESAWAFAGELRGVKPSGDSNGPPPLGWIGSNCIPYEWDDYRRLILHLRETTPPEMPVAVLLFECLSGVNAAVPRVSPLPCDVFDLIAFHEFLEDDVAAMKSEGPCVVVLDPSTHKRPSRTECKRLIPKLGPLLDLIHRDFRLESRIGPFEVWRRDGPPVVARALNPEPLTDPRPTDSARN